MPPSTSSSASMALARRNGAASKPAQQVIEIDDSSDDEVPAPLHVPRLPTTIGARSRTTVTNSASGSSGNATASVVVRRAALSSTVNSRRASQTFVDHSATEGTSDDADTRPEGHRSAKQSARNSRPTLDAHSNSKFQDTKRYVSLLILIFRTRW